MDASKAICSDAEQGWNRTRRATTDRWMKAKLVELYDDHRAIMVEASSGRTRNGVTKRRNPWESVLTEAVLHGTCKEPPRMGAERESNSVLNGLALTNDEGCNVARSCGLQRDWLCGLCIRAPISRELSDGHGLAMPGTTESVHEPGWTEVRACNSPSSPSVRARR